MHSAMAINCLPKPGHKKAVGFFHKRLFDQNGERQQRTPFGIPIEQADGVRQPALWAVFALIHHRFAPKRIKYAAIVHAKHPLRRQQRLKHSKRKISNIGGDFDFCGVFFTLRSRSWVCWMSSETSTRARLKSSDATNGCMASGMVFWQTSAVGLGPRRRCCPNTASLCHSWGRVDPIVSNRVLSAFSKSLGMNDGLGK